MMGELSSAEKVIGERLEKIGASLVKNRCTGDSAYPTEYILRYKDIQVLEPTLDLALVALVAKLGENYRIPQSYEEIETELQERREEEEAEMQPLEPLNIHSERKCSAIHPNQTHDEWWETSH